MGSDGDGNNLSDIDPRCRFCGSMNLVQDSDRGELVCNDCGLVDSLENLDIDGHVRFGDGSHNSVSDELGSFIGEGRGVPLSCQTESQESQLPAEIVFHCG